jgi:hypothetical protein
MRLSLAWYRENETMSSESEDSSLVSIANETRISRPVQLESFPVSWADWDFIKGRIRGCEIRLDWWGLATSFFFGVATLAFSVALTSDTNSISMRWLDLYWSLAIGGVVVGMASFLARRALGNSQRRSINSVLEDMTHIEQRYERPSPEIQGS